MKLLYLSILLRFMCSCKVGKYNMTHKYIDMKPLKPSQRDLLEKLYFGESFMFGRDKLWQYIKTNYPYKNISRRQIANWLNAQEISQMFHKTQPTKDLKSHVIKAPYNQIAMDVVDLQNWEHDKFKYVLTTKDLFSKKVWVEPTKDKEGATILKALKKIFDRMLRTPSTVRSDNGSEFNYEPLQAYLKKIDCIQVFASAGKPQSNGAIERFNGNMKQLLNMYLTQHDSKDWVSILPTIIDNYNNVPSRITGKTPNDLDTLTDDDKTLIIDKLKKAINKKNLNVSEDVDKFEIGDRVRLKVIGEQFQKLNGKNFTQDLFTIYKKFKSKRDQPVYYYVKSEDHEYTDKLYPEDMLLIKEIDNPVSEPVDKFVVSRIVKPVVVKNGNVYVKSFEVQWKGYKKKDNSIEPRSMLIVDVPKTVNLYEKKHKVEWKPRSVKFT